MSNKKEEKEHQKDLTRWSESPYLIIKGFLMGSADIVPGVSGGTMALITGIYHRLIDAIKSANTELIKKALKFKIKDFFQILHWKFLLLLLTGIFGAIGFFTKIVPLQIYMFTHAEIVYGLFFGLILGSIFLLIAEIAFENWTWKYTIPLVAGATFGFWIVTLVPADTPETFLFVLLSGAIAICAMILPGISGSYLLLILRKYDYILTQVGNLGTADTMEAAINLIPFFLGCVIGLALFARLLSWFLKRNYSLTILVLIGFLVGSLYVIWPYQEREFHEIVRSSETLPVTDPLVQELLDREDEPNLPEFYRIANKYNETVEVQRISRNLLHAKPIIPDSDNDMDIRGGVIGLICGLLMIWFISFLRKT